jgi:hypothetical protein
MIPYTNRLTGSQSTFNYLFSEIELFEYRKLQIIEN